MSYYAGNITAEMATVLRKNATILIRLREKMEVQFSLDSLDTNVSNHACLLPPVAKKMVPCERIFLA